MKDEVVPISSTDNVLGGDEKAHNKVRTLGEFKPTNTPLSAVEIAQRKHLAESTHRMKGWTPRTTGLIEDMVPLAEEEAAGA